MLWLTYGVGVLIDLHLNGVSNKLEKKLIAHGDYQTFVVMIPKIDKMSLVFDVPEDVGKGIIDRLLTYEEPTYLDKLWASGRYSKRFRLHVGVANQSVLIEAMPNKKALNPPPFFRFEFNPDLLGPVGLGMLRMEVKALFGPDYGWSYIAQAARVTRLDIAVDILGVPPDRVLIDTTGKAAKRVLYVGDDGVVETVYPVKGGGLKSYNKSAELQTKTPKLPYGGVPLHRIEIGTKPNKPFHELPALKNPLKSFIVRAASKPIIVPETEHGWRFFLTTCQTLGCAKALQLIADDERRLFHEAALNNADRGVWPVEKIWSTWPFALQRYSLVASALPALKLAS